MEEFRPDYVDKGEIEPEKIAEIYSEFGLYFRQNVPPRKDLHELREKYGDIANEIVYLDRKNAIDLKDSSEVHMNESEKVAAKRMAETINLGQKQPGEALATEIARQYILEPEPAAEKRNEKIGGSHQPDLGVVSVLLDALEDEPATIEKIEERMPGEPNFDYEFWLKYLETQGVSYREGEEYARDNRSKLSTEIRNRLDKIPQSLRGESERTDT
jgi:hypothetical protein